MKTFLFEVIAKALQTYPNIAEVTFILPSKRACVFLKNELSKQLNKTSFSPEILSIEDFVGNLSNLKSANNTQLLFEFYDVYAKLTPKERQEPFDLFGKWAQIVLQDFNEIDRYLIPHKEIFSYLSAIQDVNHWSLQEENSELVRNYLSFWKRLPEYYLAFTNVLISKGLGYQGLIYREAVENVEYYIQSNEQQHIFVGFNALNNAEQTIINELLQHGNAEVFWDIDEVFFNDPMHDASLFLRKYRFDWKHFQKHPFQWVSQNYSKEKKIQLVGIPKNIGQAKYVGELLTKQEIRGNDYANTAVVLSDETLLTPVLNSLPLEVERLNITMGYPLKETPTASFFEALFQLFSKQREGSFYFRNVIAFLSHPFGRILFQVDGEDLTDTIIDEIQRKNIIYLTADRMATIAPRAKTLIDRLFNKVDQLGMKSLTDNCIFIIKQLKSKFDEDDNQHLLSLEYLYRFYEVFNQIATYNEQYGHIKDLKTFISVYRELLQQETLDFQGEPLEGLQLMGMLETRVLDFETVIISSVNEGILPSGKSNSSFIPFDVKKQYGLPTYKEKDAIYTYHFYRLLQRAKNIFILYNTESEGLSAGEKSRFIMQMQVAKQPAHKIEEFIVSPNETTVVDTLKEIDKTEDMMERIREVASKGFSPTTLTTYIRNPIDFYYEKLLGISQPEEVEETVAANTLGTVVHNALETLYEPYVGKELQIDQLKAMLPKIEGLITKLFAETFGNANMTKGKNLIIFHVTKRYIENFIKHEIKELASGHSIRLISLESDLNTPVDIPELDFPVSIRGKVDRLDEYDGVLRVIDYKTGKVLQSELNVSTWNDITSDYKKYSKSIQVLCYAYMIQQQPTYRQTPMEAGVVSFKNLQQGFLKFTDKTKKSSLVSNETFDDFLFELKKLIMEICDPSIPFKEKEV